jgi:hypothetical protein
LVEAQHGAEQLARVGVLGAVVDVVERAALDYPPPLHYQHPVGDLGDHAEIMGDQDRRQAALAVQPREQREDLRLGGHVERSRRLVCDQDLRLERQRHRDHRPLPHPAGELMRVVAGTSLGLGDADRVEHLHRQAPCRAVAHLVVVGADGLDQLVADPVDRVERGHRVLEDHRYPRPPHLAQVLLGGPDQLAAMQLRRATDPRVGRAREADDRLCRDALTRARLADDRQHLTRAQLEGNPVDRPDQPVVALEGDGEVAQLEQLAQRGVPSSLIRGSR